MQKQIKITVSEEIERIIERKAKKLGLRTATYCFNLIFEYVRKEVEKK